MIAVVGVGGALAASQTLALNPGDTLHVTCTSLLSSTLGQNDADLTCATLTPVPVATMTPVPAATTTPTPGAGTIAGVPICASHDPTKYHGLVERDAAGNITCTYGHTHEDNPHALDAMFGPLPYGEISYPWQTVNATTGAPENQAKHRVYDWMVVQNQPCAVQGGGLSFTDGRVEMHADGSAGATTRFHSYFFQLKACDTRDPSFSGTISMGGHQDTGRLNAGGTDVSLPGDPAPGTRDGLTRLDGSPSNPRYDSTWYGANGDVRPMINGNFPPYVGTFFGIRKEAWGPVDPNNPTQTLFYGGANNGSYMEPLHIIGVTIPGELDPQHTGFVTFHGFTDRHGNVVANCSPAGADCIPLDIVNMKVGSYQFRNDAHPGLGVREYDVQSGGQSLIQFPN